MRWVAAFVAVALISTAFAVLPSGNTIDAPEMEFLSILNEYRESNSLEPLVIDIKLQDAAEWMSKDMAVNNRFSHTDSLGRSPWARMDAFGYNYNTFRGENIAAGYQTAQSVFEGWKGSPGHDANMLGANYRAIGIALVKLDGSTFGSYWTTDFGGFISQTPAPAITASPSPAPSCFGDMNGDRMVNLTDILMFPFGAKIGDSRYLPEFDLNGDGTINLRDILRLGAVFGTVCS